MGYYVRLEYSTVKIPKANKDAVLARWKELNDPKYNKHKNGGSWTGGKQTSWNYSWMDTDYDKTCNTIEEILEMMGFGYHTHENGDVSVTSYDNKTGQEDIFFGHIADLIPDGQYIDWVGEEEESWRWIFSNGKMVNQEPTYPDYQDDDYE